VSGVECVLKRARNSCCAATVPKLKLSFARERSQHTFNWSPLANNKHPIEIPLVWCGLILLEKQSDRAALILEWILLLFCIAQDDAKRRWMSQSLFERDDGIAAHVAVRCSSSLRINYIIMR
jgi:hypothetical protein